ncbi:MAG: histidine ammonia-lyase [Anaerolineales bacterium]|nr:histidine ammonia-lyase [Anaerolineales bacterium]MCB9128545.1 histidine ammonia-lyase [Ardenticatenales bacterium]
MIVLNGETLRIRDVVRVARAAPRDVKVQLSDEARQRMARSRAAVEALVDEGRVAYGITTGFGAFKDRVIDRAQLGELQRNLVLSHAVGVGPEFDAETTRAIILIRANQLARGYSGIRIEVVERLLALLDHGILPCIPQQGSLGSSGDLAPLAHLALTLIGGGEAMLNGERMSGAAALQHAGLEPVVLQAKEGLALLNGTAVMSAVAVLATHDAEVVSHAADIAGALSLEAMEGTGEAYDERLHAIRPHPRLVETAHYMRHLLEGSEFLRKRDPKRVQDAYSARCLPQIHGAVREAIAYAKWLLRIELNSATDNPLIFVDEDTGAVDVLSGGNFHGEPVSLAMDYLTMALVELANVSERRINRLVDAKENCGVLPAFLTEEGGLNSGFMIAHYTAASLVSENKVLAHPASADSVPTSADIEDHQSLGTIAARQCREVLGNSATVVGIELFAAAQGIDFRRKGAGRDLALGVGTAPVYALIRDEIPFIEADEWMQPHVLRAKALVLRGAITEAAERAVWRHIHDETGERQPLDSVGAGGGGGA